MVTLELKNPLNKLSTRVDMKEESVSLKIGE